MAIHTILPRVGGMSYLYPSLSADGRYLSFANFYAFEKPDPVASQRGSLDLYRLDVFTGQIVQVTAPHDEGFRSALAPVMSADGKHIAYIGWRNIADVYYQDVVFKDMVSGTTVRLAQAQESAGPFYDYLTLSADGHRVAYQTRHSFMDDSDARLVVQDASSGRILYQEDAARPLQWSSDGKWLLVRGYDALERVNLDTGKRDIIFESNQFYFNPVDMSADGRYIAYETTANLVVPGGREDLGVIARKDLATGAVAIVFEQSTDYWTFDHDVRLSPDGRFVTYRAQEITDTSVSDVRTYVKDLQSGATSILVDDWTSEPTVIDGMAAYVTSSTVPNHSETELAIAVATFATGAAAMYASGTANADVLVGKSGNDSLSGAAGNDILFGGMGSDTLDGGAGLDLASFLGQRTEYALAHKGAAWTVQGKAGNEGIDTLVNIERLHFADGNVALDVDGIAGQAYRIYQAAFARTPDAGGLGFWIAQMDKGLSLDAAAQGFVVSDEFAKLYANATGNRAIVEQFYQNVLHRAGEGPGIDFWTNVLDTKAATLAQVLVGFSEGHENQAALVGVMADGIAYTPYFG